MVPDIQPAALHSRSLREGWFILLAVVLIVPLLAFTVLQIHRPQVEAAARQNLANITSLKAEKVSLWLAERMRSVQVFELNEGFNRRVENLAHTGNVTDARLIQARLEAVEKNYHYESAVILHTDGSALLQRGTVDHDLLSLAQQTLQQQTPHFSALHSDRADRAYLDISSPLFVTENGGRQLVGSIALRQYVDTSLAHLTLQWPSLSGTGENMLLIRDPNRDSVQGLILENGKTVMAPLPDELSFIFDQVDSDTAFNYLNRHGQAALAAADAVEGTDWVLLSIQDRHQILSPVYQLIFWVSLVATAAVVVSSSATLLLFRQQRRTLQLRQQLEKRKADQMIERDQRIAAAAFEGHHTAMFVTEVNGLFIRINQAFTRITGYDGHDIKGHTPALLKSGRQSPEFYETFWHALLHDHYWEGEIWNRRKNGEIYPEWLSISAVLDQSGEVVNFVGSFTDISTSKEAQRQIQWLSHFDRLTGLPNASLLKDRTEQLLNATGNDEAVAMVRIDLDQFKTINDSLSHRLGDQVLIRVAERLQAAIGPSDILSRQSGDEFTLLMTFPNKQTVTALLTRVHQVISAPITIEDQELIITASAGIALYPTDGQDFDGLNKAAEVAMFRAKQDGRNRYAFYEAAMQEEALRALQLSTALHRAEEEGQFQLYYQPQRDLLTGRLCGAEALLRWQHPEFGWVSPGEFIPLAEGNGLIVSIGDWTLRTAMHDRQTWLAAGLNDLSVAVNLSPLQFRQTDLLERIASLLRHGQLPGQHLELELTETAAMDNPERAVEVMQGLHDMGISVAIDDFGTGYSSMNYLKSFAVDKLKVDRSFIDGIDTNEENQAIVLAIIRMAQALDIQILAEGVERVQEQEFLAANGCAMMQGYLYGKPMPADEFLMFARRAGAV